MKSTTQLLYLERHYNAVYECPKDGYVRKGPLVVFAKKDEHGRNFVGDIYINFRRIEAHPEVVEAFAEVARQNLFNQDLLEFFDTVCGIPNGGRTFGQELARIAEKRFVYPDRMPKPSEPGKKQEYTWDFSQFEFEKGERVAVAEDIYHFFQNTDNTLEAIAGTGAEVVLLVGAHNRSPVWEQVYVPKTGHCAGKVLPLITAVREVYPEYRQDDPEVAADVAAGNLEFEVKKNWARLCAAMLQ